VWPGAVPLAGDIDWGWLAHALRLSGAEIKNVALGAAFLAAADGGPVTSEHIRYAVQGEYGKAGRTLTGWVGDGG
jgi:hypothetical protein